MRGLLVALLCLVAPAIAPPAFAQDPPRDVKGLFLLTDYPAVTVRPGTTSTVSLRLHNYGLPPERLALRVDGVPSGWTATLLGGGQPVAAAMPATNSSVGLELRLDVPREAEMTTQTLTINAEGGNTRVSLPVAVSLARDLPAKLSLQAQLPELRGSARSSFEYQLSIKNDSGKRVLVSLAAQAPQNFETSFTEAFGSQELSAVPIEAGQSKDVKLRVRPPNTIGAGKHRVVARVGAEDATVTNELSLEITGQPKLDLTGRDGVVSGRAVAGTETSIPVQVTNSGTAAADDIELAGTAPSGWKLAFEPKNLERVAPGETKQAEMRITPAANAIAGDYVATLRATARGETASSNFRVAVTTSTLWGIVGIGIIGIALLVLVGAVAWFGRR
jgi:uncharacterized membrane protein